MTSTGLSRGHGSRATRAGGAVVFVLLTCCGCFTGQKPTAERVRADEVDPHGEIHFVEHGHRSKGVLVAATKGFNNAFSATWVTMLVPMPPTTLAGPVWTGRRGDTYQASAIANLPAYRDTRYASLYGDQVRARCVASAIWILSTDPFILGLPAGEPLRSWREFPFLVRYVVDEELQQPIGRLVVLPRNFWDGGPGVRRRLPENLEVVRLAEPVTIHKALDGIAAGSAMRLGVVESVPDGTSAGRERP